MSGLLYYLPNQTRAIKLPEVRALGLGYAFDSRMVACGVAKGPDDQQGAVIGDDRHLELAHIGYYPDRQRWLKIPKQDAWVGLTLHARPRPEELLRSRALRGHRVKLRDGQEWEIPVARALIEDAGELLHRCELPAGTSLDADGNWTRGALDEAEAQLWEIAQNWWAAYTAAIRPATIDPAEDDEETETPAPVQSAVTFDFAGLNDAALTALAYNYRLGKAEVALLGLFDDQCAAEILKAVTDWPTFLEFIKKKLATGPPGS